MIAINENFFQIMPYYKFWMKVVIFDVVVDSFIRSYRNGKSCEDCIFNGHFPGCKVTFSLFNTPHVPFHTLFIQTKGESKNKNNNNNKICS